ncbi:MAG: gamma-glutamyltranspeptidase [Acidobacteria bacterium]|nr:gamma-glutamyltranspeptidase [Acidobacteriota bacterium]
MIRIVLAVLMIDLVLMGQQKAAERPIRKPARGVRGAVTGGTDYATEAGMRMFHLGGNAVDAGVAATFAGAVTEFSHYGFGGEAPILIRTREGKVFAIAGVGTMPKAANAEFFRQRKLRPGEVFIMEPNGLKGMVPAGGVMPALVPGMPEAALVALREFGTKTVAEVIQPAIDLADGMALDDQRTSSIYRSKQFFDLWPTSKAVFLPGPRMPVPGDVFRQPDLARTLRSMVGAEQRARAAGLSRHQAIDSVRDYFYRGDVARRIDAFIRQHNGLLHYEDMAAFRLQPEEAASTTYRGYTVYKPGFWSQGPVLLQALNMLEQTEVRFLKHNSAEYLHQLVETLKLAYADRDTYYGDPKFAQVPAERLLSKAYAAQRRAEISPRGSNEFRPGRPEGTVGIHPSESVMVRIRIDDALMAMDTTTINAMDKDGVMFAATPSGAWLPSVIAGDTGIPLTQRAQTFLLIDGHPNELAGGKRPRITLSPTLVTRDGKPYVAISTPGGDNQDQAILQILLNMVEFNMDVQEAVEAPRFQTRHLVSSFDNHAMGRGELVLDERIPITTVQELAGRGHKASGTSRWNNGSAPTLIRRLLNGVIEAGADPYGHRSALAW